MPSILKVCFAFFIAVAAVLPGSVQADTAASLREESQAAWKQGDLAKALELADKAVAKGPTDPRNHLLRGLVREARREYEEAIKDFTKCLELDPKSFQAYHHRGSVHFKRGHIAESLADWDKQLELRPADSPGHWQRGISLYYAGRFDEGRKQFEGYEKVDTNDVENAVWQFLCNARLVGVDKARASMLKIGLDRRVPMMQVYDLYRGKLKPDDVLAAVEKGMPTPQERSERLFYAHLYLGLYYEATGDKDKAREHISLAAEKYRIPSYMGDVAWVHKELLNKKTP
jgi:lipoprotein NlpI